MKSHATAETTVEGIIAVNGDFIDGKIVNEVDKDTSDSALKATAKYRFKPATLEGKPVAVPMRVVVHYQ